MVQGSPTKDKKLKRILVGFYIIIYFRNILKLKGNGLSITEIRRRCFSWKCLGFWEYLDTFYYNWLLKSKIFAEVPFLEISGCYYKQNKELFCNESTEGIVRCIFLKIPERFSRIIFQNSSERLLVEIP